MIITVNSKPCNIKDNCYLTDVLDEIKLVNRVGIAIAVNNTVVPKTEWEKHIVNNKDNIVIINAIFGG
ncbi:MAG: sulfur carrier protein ThiS [Bacteroidales bacterium]|jgi:sulfur carrier protein|nr:sulfur carrier protein ThiS [Bacteroidales bacterium]